MIGKHGLEVPTQSKMQSLQEAARARKEKSSVVTLKGRWNCLAFLSLDTGTVTKLSEAPSRAFPVGPIPAPLYPRCMSSFLPQDLGPGHFVLARDRGARDRGAAGTKRVC